MTEQEVEAAFRTLVADLSLFEARTTTSWSRNELQNWLTELNQRRAERGEGFDETALSELIEASWQKQLKEQQQFERFRAPSPEEPAGRIVFAHDDDLKAEFVWLLADVKSLFDAELGHDTGGKYSVRLALKVALLLLARIPSEVGGVTAPLKMLDAALASLDDGETHPALRASPKAPNRSTPSIQKKFRIRCCLAVMALEAAGRSASDALNAVFKQAEPVGARFTETAAHRKFSLVTLERWVSDFRSQVRRIPKEYCDDDLSPEQLAFELYNCIDPTDVVAQRLRAETLLASLSFASLRRDRLG